MDEQLSSGFDSRHSFGAIRAIGVLMIFIFVMVVGDGAAALLINKALDSGFTDVAKDSEHTASALLVLRQLAGLLAVSAFLFLYLKINFTGAFKRKNLAQIGLVGADRQWIIFGALTGFLLSFFSSRVIALWFPPDKDVIPNPILSETQTGDWIQYLAAFMVVCIAPVTEELLFRGMLYKGFSTSWGKIPAAIVVIILFVLVHDETLRGGYWLGIFGLIVISIVLILARELSGSLIPPILMHAGFNLAVVLPF
jgi:membrane protease YdiL (CAAX protease family)